MKCPSCGASVTRVIETHREEQLIWRYRVCKECGNTWRTHERAVWKVGKEWSVTPVVLEGDE